MAALSRSESSADAMHKGISATNAAAVAANNAFSTH
jgi:hypothetical protein